jgi:hypothetical protein
MTHRDLIHAEAFRRAQLFVLVTAEMDAVR